jgi:hypothetical protein
MLHNICIVLYSTDYSVCLWRLVWLSCLGWARQGLGMPFAARLAPMLRGWVRQGTQRALAARLALMLGGWA